MKTPNKDHWQQVYQRKAATAVSWFQPHAALSLKLIKATGVPAASAAIIDIGGGASTLVDDLLRSGYRNVTVLDLAGAALQSAQQRLGQHASQVTWLEADITQVALPQHAYDIWHDRAVFHFLTAAEDRHAYVQTILHAVKPGAHVIIATFAEDGPSQCSGLPVQRYSSSQLQAELGAHFTLLQHSQETHHTPGGAPQPFTYCWFRRH